MKKTADKTNYFFVDESGDTVFFDKYGNLILNKEGISKTLILGFIKTHNPNEIRRAVLNLKEQIKKDDYLKNIPSIKKTLIAFHAKDDTPEIRERFFKLIITLDFTAEVFVARKIPEIFIKRHKKNENNFYDDLIIKLFENKLHLAKFNKIYFSVRGSKTRRIPLENAIKKAILNFENKWKTKINSSFEIIPQSPSGEPCLQVIDYINWAVQRAFEKRQDRFLNFVKNKIVYLVDLYDKNKYPKNFYNKNNPFDLKKISPL